MPRIAPIPWEELTTLPLQIVAHRPDGWQGMDESYKAIYGQVVGGHRFLHALDVLGDDEPVITAEGALTSGIGPNHE